MKKKLKKYCGILVCHMSSLKTLISMSKRKNHYTLFDLSCQFFFLKQNENSMVVDGRI